MDMLSTLMHFFLFPVSFVVSSHFRGGTISWTYTGRNNEVEFFFKLGWTYGNGPGCSRSTLGQLATRMNSTFWMCTSGCGSSPTPLDNVNYYCTGASSTENFEQGERTFTYDFPGSGPFAISFSGGAWMSLDYGPSGSWNIQTTVFLGRRSDTGAPNHSPQTLSKPSYTFQYGCNISFKIPMIDADNDDVRCRWATGNECSSVCQGLPNATLDHNTCTISFQTSHTSNGWYAIAITVEDFPSTNIIAGGRSYTTSTPLSSVPLQFLINTPLLPGGCNERPVFVSSTPTEGEIIAIPAHQSLNTRLYAHSSRTISSITLTAPAGLGQSSLLNDDQSRPYVKYISITWTPSRSQKGSHILCGQADDRIGKISDPRCVTLLAWDIDPCDSGPCYNNATCGRVGWTDRFTCTCLPGFTGHLCEIDIDECASSPCLNNATCNDLVNNFACDCVPGFTDYICSTDINECASQPCHFGATCNDLINYFTCTCAPGYTGILCEIEINDCLPEPCGILFDCHDEINGYRCTINTLQLAAIILSSALAVAGLVFFILRRRKNKIANESIFHFGESKPDTQAKVRYVHSRSSSDLPTEAKQETDC